MMDSKRRKPSDCNSQLSRGAIELPHDILSDILCRLPIESILTCKVVCKTWHAVTRDRCFTDKLGNSPYQTTRLILKPLPMENNSWIQSHLVLLDIEERKTRLIPIDKTLAELRIMCCCNGLLCMASATELDPVVIFNPITRESLILPSSDSKRPVLRHRVGLGFDPSTNKFKVVRAYTSIKRQRVRRIEIISLGETSWRKLSAPLSILDLNGRGAKYWDGALYWKTKMGEFNAVIQLDLSDEKFRAISFPENYSDPIVPLGFIAVGGCLTLVQNSNSLIEMWRLMQNEVGRELSFCVEDTYDSYVMWRGSLRCKFVCQLDQESYLLRVRSSTCQNNRRDHLTRYFPEKTDYLNLAIDGLPLSFKAVHFKPSLIPLCVQLHSVPAVDGLHAYQRECPGLHPLMIK